MEARDAVITRPPQLCTQGEREQQQAEAAQVQGWLLVHLRHCVQGHDEQQRRPREGRAVQEAHQDGTQRKVARVCNTCPHGCQA